ncbi:glycosyltransferase family 4 protein [Perlabentimonas gracilis]|uniref:glycosyltransferase family 4 protein n=1 Tax=Perlabentimonas gracilis TaxID=2715279 RepID=UPI00140E65F9|nr:glycosyltransferase family 4 protein [Perlabentimonas gracilis]NHB69533.1 glycosyltransferase family 4 protein [Perlabentimonas gracilis]
MKIVSIVPGFGGTFYCGNCLRDSAFVKALRAAGHDAITLPLYLPLSSNGFDTESDIPVFYGAVNIYFEQNFRLFRNIPLWLRKILNSPPVLRFAARMSSSTRATGLEDMTISMLRGRDGFQSYELDELISYLKHHEKPDIIHLSNALLLGLAKGIRDELNIPVVCTLQDEDVWVEVMNEPYRSQVWDLMSENGNYVDAFITVSQFFADKISRLMTIPSEKLHVVPLGVDPSVYQVKKPNLDVPTIGFLSRSNAGNGFEILIDAFILLKQNSQFKNARLKVTGGRTGDDMKFINRQLKKLKAKGYQNDIEFVEDFRTESLRNFFEGLTLLSVPVQKGEAFGLYQLESLASGIPIVQPAVGAFPEIVANSGGGLIYEPNTPDALAKKWEQCLLDKDLIMRLSENGRKAIEEKYSSTVMLSNMVEVYRNLVCLDNDMTISTNQSRCVNF